MYERRQVSTKKGGIPPDYTLLNWIGSDRSQRMVLAQSFSSDTGVKFGAVEISSIGTQYYTGSAVDESTGNLARMLLPYRNSVSSIRYGWELVRVSVPLEVEASGGGEYAINYMNNGIFEYNGNQESVLPQVEFVGGEFILFGFAKGFNTAVEMKLSYIQITEGFQIVSDMLPCLDANMIPCLYDVIQRNTIYKSQGNEFTYG